MWRDRERSILRIFDSNDFRPVFFSFYWSCSSSAYAYCELCACDFLFLFLIFPQFFLFISLFGLYCLWPLHLRREKENRFVNTFAHQVQAPFSTCLRLHVYCWKIFRRFLFFPLFSSDSMILFRFYWTFIAESDDMNEVNAGDKTIQLKKNSADKKEKKKP